MQEFVRQAKGREAAGVLQHNPLSVKSSPLSAKRRAQGQLQQQRANQPASLPIENHNEVLLDQLLYGREMHRCISVYSLCTGYLWFIY